MPFEDYQERREKLLAQSAEFEELDARNFPTAAEGYSASQFPKWRDPNCRHPFDRLDRWLATQCYLCLDCGRIE
jgi:hypothetical protein